MVGKMKNLRYRFQTNEYFGCDFHKWYICYPITAKGDKLKGIKITETSKKKAEKYFWKYLVGGLPFKYKAILLNVKVEKIPDRVLNLYDLNTLDGYNKFMRNVK